MSARRDAVVATLCLACAACNEPTRREPAERKAKAPPLATAELAAPRLVVVVVIDQLPSWSFETDLPYLDDGFARLIAEGAYYPSAEFPYAATFTAAGHAAIATGAAPDVTGILGNSWFERAENAAVSAVGDRNSPVFYVHGTPPANYVPEDGSGHRLLVDGIGDVLTAHTNGGGKSVAVGLKDRGAIVVLGRHPTLAVWYDESQPAMTTSTYYAAALPPWISALPPVSDRFGFVWEPRDRDRLTQLCGADVGEGEGENDGLDTSFPHILTDCQSPAKALRSTPVGTDLVFDTARAAVVGEKLGADDIPDILALSLSSHDYAGHDWGQESWERTELLFALDRSLGEFLRFLDSQLGADRYAVVLTSDHGAVPMVERSRKAGRVAVRVPYKTLIDTAQAAAARVLGPGQWAASYSASTLYMSGAFLALPAARRYKALDAIEAAVAKIEGIGFARRADKLTGRCDSRTGQEALACRSLYPPRSGELFIAPARYCLLSQEWTTGTGHGTPSEEDRFVPLIVRAPGFRPGRRTHPVSMLQVAPTLAALLQIPPPPAARAKPLE